MLIYRAYLLGNEVSTALGQMSLTVECVGQADNASVHCWQCVRPRRKKQRKERKIRVTYNFAFERHTVS
jgi:hypothetical protein